MNFLRNYIKSILWATVVMVLCTIPVGTGSAVKLPHSDKLVHFGMFGLLMLLLLFENRSYRNSRPLRWQNLRLLALILFYGSATELIQHYLIPYRSGELLDLLADIGGALAALTVFPVVDRLFGK